MTWWSNQWEPSTKRQHANEVYEARWPKAQHCGDDIGTVPTEDIPDHDLLLAVSLPGLFGCDNLEEFKALRGKKEFRAAIERILREKGDSAPRYFFENVGRLQQPSSQRGQILPSCSRV